MSRRPYGVGLLVAGHDVSCAAVVVGLNFDCDQKTGPHLFNTCPSGNYFEYKAMAIGARSQAARTYLERHFDTFESLGLDELITHALLALKEAVGSAGELTSSNCELAFVGADGTFKILEDSSVKPYVDILTASDQPSSTEEAASGAGDDSTEQVAPTESMQTD